MLTTCYPLGRDDVSCTFVHHLSKALAQAGLQVSVVAPGAPNVPSRETWGGVAVSRFTYMWPRRWQGVAYRWGIPQNLRRNRWLALELPIFFLTFLFAAFRACRSADVIHCHWIPTAWVGVIVGWLLRKPVVLTVMGSDAWLLPGAVARWVSPHVSAVHVISTELRETVRALGHEGVLIPLPSDEDVFNPQADAAPIRAEFGLGDDPAVCFIARLAAVKDPLTFVRAMPAVLARRPDVRFLLVGDGPLKAEVEALAGSLGCRDHLVVAGARPDVYRFLKASFAFVALSPVENVWSCTIAEAMLVGVPCILTASGHTPRFFADGGNCRIIPVGDADALAEAILDLLADPDLARRLAAGADELLRRERRRTALVQADMMALYDRAIGRRSSEGVNA
jgi:glycosyltransferase involved in cell wall biosynthesis